MIRTDTLHLNLKDRLIKRGVKLSKDQIKIFLEEFSSEIVDVTLHTGSFRIDNVGLINVSEVKGYKNKVPTKDGEGRVVEVKSSKKVSLKVDTKFKKAIKK